MKKWMCIVISCLFLSLLAACGQGQDAPAEKTATLPQGAETMVCRVVQEEDGSLLLAQMDGGPAAVYSLSLQGKEILFEDSARTELEEGDLVKVVYNGFVMETYPAQLGNVSQVIVQKDGFDDLCDLYLEVLEDLMEEDKALAHGVTQLGLDLSKTRLSPAEQSAIALVLEWEEDLPVVTGTWQELADQGYIDDENLYWEDGLFLSIEEQEGTGENAVTFDAQSWRSGLGAYFFCDCTASRPAHGHWSDYKVGSFAIS